MGANSGVEWCKHTFNTHWGCTKVDEECESCYALTGALRWGYDIWGPLAARRPMSENYWRQIRKWNRDAAKSGERTLVFCDSMADVFEGPETCQVAEHYKVVEDGRNRLFREIVDAPALTFLLLTKRPQNMVPFQPADWSAGWPANVWAGTTVGHQKAIKRAAVLTSVPATVHFVSCEPLLGPLDLYIPYLQALLGQYPFQTLPHEDRTPLIDRLDWVIVGGESGHGPKIRPMDPEWARSLRDQCVVAKVPFFFKQWGEWCPPAAAGLDHYRTFYTIHEKRPRNREMGVVRVGKHASGRLLDGQLWDEYPA